MTPEQIQGWLQLGLGGFMLAALFLGHRRIWVFGSFYQDMIAYRDRWRDLALRAVPLAEKATTVAELTVKNGPKTT